jgi:hypothetical protein
MAPMMRRDGLPGDPPSHLPGDPPAQSPENFILEAAAAAGLISQLKDGADLYKQFQAAQVPFHVNVVESTLLAEFHYVTFLTTNATAHGLYIERLTIALPERRDEPLSDLRLLEMKVARIGLDDDGPSTQAALADWFPQYVKPARDLEFTVKIPVLNRQIHEQVPYLIATFLLSHLNEKKPHTVQQEFRVRWKTP